MEQTKKTEILNDIKIILEKKQTSIRIDNERVYFFVVTIPETDLTEMKNAITQAYPSIYARCWKIGNEYKIYVSDGTKANPKDIQQTNPQNAQPQQPQAQPTQATQDLNEQVKHFLKFLETKDFDLTQDKAEQLLTAVNSKSNIILIGETATGKTTLIKHLSEFMNKATTLINCNPYLESEDIKGRYIAKPNDTNTGLNIYWIKSQIHHALENNSIIVFEEINFLNPSLYSTLYELGDFRKSITLTERQGETISNPDTILISTLNNGYSGTFDLWNNPAFLRRGGNAIIKMDYITPERESQLIARKIGVDKKILLNVCKVIAHLRKERQEGNSDIIDIGIDRTEHIARFIKSGLSLKNALEIGLVNYIAKDQETANAIREKISLFIDLTK